MSVTVGVTTRDSVVVVGGESVGPSEVAWEWVEAATAENLEAAWPLMDPEWRLELARDFLHVKPHLAPLIAEAEWRAAWPTFFRACLVNHLHIAVGDVDSETWGTGINPRPVAPGIEDVVFLKTDAAIVQLEQDTVADLGIRLRLTEDGWRVCGVPWPAAARGPRGHP